jgi:heme A synthase
MGVYTRYFVLVWLTILRKFDMSQCAYLCPVHLLSEGKMLLAPDPLCDRRFVLQCLRINKENSWNTTHDVERSFVTFFHRGNEMLLFILIYMRCMWLASVVLET